MPAAAETQNSPRVALVIGNGKYETAVGPLRNAVNDARAISKTLRGLGFSVIEEHNVTRDELLESVAEFRGKLHGAQVALFYYAGHGISVAGSNYLIPVKSGYKPDEADETTRRMLAETKLFNAEQAVAEMSSAGGGCNLIILDACRSTPLARDSHSRGLTTPGGLTEMKPPAGSLVAFSTDAGRTAQDGEGSNGLYTEELLKHLRTPGLTIEQVFKRTRADVMQRSKGDQIPAEYSRLVGEDIYLAGPAATEPATESPHVLKAEPVKLPTQGAIYQLAAAGKVEECIEALKLTESDHGGGDYAAIPLETLLELAKEDLKDANLPAPKLENAMHTCDLVLETMVICLPPGHAKNSYLTAKAQNRRGDCLLRLGRAEDAIQAYNIAIPLAPQDAYPVFNRGRAKLALGNKDDARADFTTASSTKYNQPKARKLALTALADMQ